MFSASADFNDLIYSTFKDYAAEAAKIEGNISRLRFDYEVIGRTGTRQASEVHELGLFTTAQLLRAFAEAGLDTEFDPKGLTDRGLYLARIRI